MIQIAKFILDSSTCRNCAQIIKKRISAIPGVEGIEMDFSKGVISIEYQLEISQQKIFEKVFDELGYSCNGGYVRKKDSCC